jgi:hypothetical protein
MTIDPVPVAVAGVTVTRGPQTRMVPVVVVDGLAVDDVTVAPISTPLISKLGVKQTALPTAMAGPLTVTPLAIVYVTPPRVSVPAAVPVGAVYAVTFPQTVGAVTAETAVI